MGNDLLAEDLGYVESTLDHLGKIRNKVNAEKSTYLLCLDRLVEELVEASLDKLSCVELLEQADQELDSRGARLPRLLVLLHPTTVNDEQQYVVLSTYQSLTDHAIQQYSLVVRREKCDELYQVGQKVEFDLISIAQKLRGHLNHERPIIVLIKIIFQSDKSTDLNQAGRK